jgi:hypothetical protein
VPIDDRANPRLVKPKRGGEQADGAIQILSVLANDGDTVRMTILYEDLTISVEDDAARRAKREGPLVIVLGEFLEFGVLNDLENPEADDQNGENGRDQRLEDRQPGAGASPFFVLRHF